MRMTDPGAYDENIDFPCDLLLYNADGTICTDLTSSYLYWCALLVMNSIFASTSAIWYKILKFD